MEEAQDDVRLSPKRTKKMKAEKTGEPQNERPRNSTRLIAHKAVKTSLLIPTQHFRTTRPNEHHQNCYAKYQCHNCTDECGYAG